MRVCCTGWHVCAAALWLVAATATAQDVEEEAPAEAPAEPAVEATASAPAEVPGDAAEALASPVEEEAAPPDEFAELDDEAPPSAPAATAPRGRLENTLEDGTAAPPRWWRYPRAGTQRPQTLPQGVMAFRSTISVAVVPLDPGRSSARGSGFFGYSVGIFDDLEIGTNPVGVTFLPPFAFADPSLFLRARLVSGEVQFSLRGEWTIPLTSNASAWMGYSAELAWTPFEWFRFETALEYGLHFTQPLQQTIFVPVRALFQAGPNTFGVTTGAVMYNDADDFDVPLFVRYSVAFGGHQGPLSEPAIEGGFGDLTQADQSWFIRGVWTFYAYP